MTEKGWKKEHFDVNTLSAKKQKEQKAYERALALQDQFDYAQLINLDEDEPNHPLVGAVPED